MHLCIAFGAHCNKCSKRRTKPRSSGCLLHAFGHSARRTGGAALLLDKQGLGEDGFARNRLLSKIKRIARPYR